MYYRAGTKITAPFYFIIIKSGVYKSIKIQRKRKQVTVSCNISGGWSEGRHLFTKAELDSTGGARSDPMVTAISGPAQGALPAPF